ncbi:MAG: DUF5329 domain-containing protein [Syntrophorhabdales bacterium]|jgi:hypothetical protein
MRRTTTAAVVICLWLSVSLFLPCVGLSDELSPTTKAEIAHLLDYVEKCNCQFNRNGTWYQDTKAIRGHAEMKLRYFMGKGKIHSTEEFIAWAASRSELSGKSYLVQCGNGSPIPTAQWFTDEMERYRKETAVTRSEPITASK